MYETDVKDNWILDVEHSNKSQYSIQTEIALSAINSQIGENLDVFEYKTTNFDIELNKNNFQIPSNIISKPTSKYRNYIYNSQNWIGHVIELFDDSFTAKLIDKYDPTTYEIAQFETAEVSDDDIELLKLGAVFYWFVGFANQDGRVFKQSLVKFKRALDLSVSEFDSIKDKVDELSDTLIWDLTTDDYSY